MSTRKLTTKQVAERWGLAPRTVQNWRTRKLGPKYQRKSDGKKYIVLYDFSDIKEFEKASRLAGGIRV